MPIQEIGEFKFLRKMPLKIFLFFSDLSENFQKQVFISNTVFSFKKWYRVIVQFWRFLD